MLVIVLPGTPAQAASSRTWLSGVGSDSNPCSRTAPCLTLFHALSQTDAGGEVDILDSGDFGDAIITQAVTIVNQGAVTGFTGGISVSAGAGDVVTLRGLNLVSAVFFSVLFFDSGAELHVENCQITGGVSIALEFTPKGASQLFVSDTIVRASGGREILIRPEGAGTADVVLERVQAINNSLGGIVATAGKSSGSGTVVNVAVRDSVASGNGGIGILATSQVGGPNVVMTLDHVAATSNGIGIEADGSDMGAGGIALSNTQVSGNGTGLAAVNGGVLVSFGNNYVIGNGTDGAPTTTRAPM
jgi:hypothetical protein